MQVVTVGREPDNTIQLKGDKQVSRHHAQLTNDNGQYYITDLGSTNGSYVNGRLVQGTQRLQMRDVVRLGNTTIPWLMYFDPNYVRHLKAQNAPTPGNSSPTPPVGGAIYVNPGQGGGSANDNETNGMAIAGFVLSFIFPVLGIIFSIVGLNNANKLPSQKGLGLSIAGIIISIVNLIIGLILLAI